jgi:hypothetical protein
MKITLKNIKYAAFLSQETNAYSATVYADGVKLCTVDNDGHGGCDCHAPLKGEGWDRIRAVEAELGKTKIVSSIDVDGKKFKYPNSLDVECGERMNEWHRLNDVKKACRRICWVEDIKSKDIFQMPAKYKPTLEGLKRIQECQWWKPKWTLINGMKPEDAIKLVAFGAEPADESFWCECDEQPGINKSVTYHADQHDNDGARTSKHHWTCDGCGKTTQVG